MKFDRNFNRDIANGREAEENINWLKKLTLNKWSLTFAVILVMLSAYLGLEEVDKQQQLQQQQADEVLYVLDTLPYDIQKVNADGDLAVLGEDGQPPAGQQSQPGTDDKKRLTPRLSRSKSRRASRGNSLACRQEAIIFPLIATVIFSSITVWSGKRRVPVSWSFCRL